MKRLGALVSLLILCFLFNIGIVKASDSLGCIDFPLSNSNYFDKLNIQGWIMSTSNIDNIKAYVDNEEYNFSYIRYERADVLAVIKGYGNENVVPGFKGMCDISMLNPGNHILKLEFYSSNVKMYEVSKTFVINNVSKICIDNPREIVFGNNIFIRGWVMNSNIGNKLDVYIDDNFVPFTYEFERRQDVLNVIKGYGDRLNNPKPGFKGYINTSSLKNGNHEIKINSVSAQGEILATYSRQFELQKYKSTIRLDKPSDGSKISGNKLTIRGWHLSTADNTKLEVLVNGNDVTENINRTLREDAIRVYGSEYGAKADDLAGYDGVVDVSNIKDGTVTIKVNVKDGNTDEILSTISKQVKLQKYKSTIRLDKPSDGSKISGNKLTIRGWHLSTADNTKLEVLVNGNDVTENINRTLREDAIRVYGSEYGAKADDLAGYDGSIDVLDMKDGPVAIKVKVKDANTGEILALIERNIKLKKYDGIINVDFPNRRNFSRENVLTVQGWELSSSERSAIEVSIDNIKQVVTRYERPDVLSVYPDSYGGPSVNPHPGFISTISLSKFSDGLHKVKIKLYNKFAEVIDEQNINIYVYSNAYFGIDVSSHQGIINWSEVKKSGIDFAIIRLGYGSNFTSQDDVQFVNNVAGAANNGIPYGVYLYSYTTLLHGPSGLNQDSPNSDSEAAHALRQLSSISNLQKRYLKLPVFIDMEEEKNIYLGKPMLTAIANNFCMIMESSGYKCGVYANKNWLNNYLDSTFLSSKYDIWLAHYTTNTDYTGIYQIWQYSSSGTLRGINSQGLDLNVSYKKYW